MPPTPQFSVLSYKFSPPRLAGIIPRNRLLNHMEEARDKRLVMITGQAAQGKTTLAASHLHNGEGAFVWINLEPSDSDPLNLYQGLVQAAAMARPGGDFQALLQRSGLSLGPRAPKPLYREWLRGLFDMLPARLDYVFDGLDRLEPQAPAFGLLETMLELMPLGSRALMTSRAMPPLEVERLRMTQDALILGNADLAFDANEVQVFLKGKGFKLDKEEASRVRQITEGWVGGLVLLCESQSLVRPGSPDSLSLPKATETLKATSYNYFAEQVLARQSESIQSFLLETSVLEVVEADMAASLTGQDNAREILAQLAGRNLFVTRFHDEGRGWVFRYHLAFRDFLQSELKARRGQPGLNQVLARAGKVCQEAGQMEPALDLHLQAGQYAPAATLLHQLAPSLLMAGRNGDLGRWLGSLPPQLLEDNPWLLLYLCQTRRWTGTRENLQCLPELVRYFRAAGDVKGQLAALACLLEAALLSGIQPASVADIVGLANRLLEDNKRTDYPLERAFLLLSLGIHSVTYYNNARQGLGASQRVLVLAEQLGVLPLRALAMHWIAHNLACLGETKPALEALARLEEMRQDLNLPDFEALCLLVRFRIFFWLGQPDLALPYIEAAERMAAELGMASLFVPCVVYRILFHALRGELGQAQAVFEQTRGSGQNAPPLFLVFGLTALSMGCYHSGLYEKADDFFRQSRGVIPGQDSLHRPPMAEERAVAGLIAYHLGRLDPELEEDLRQGLEEYTRMGSHHDQADIALVLALYALRAGDRPEAARLIGHGLGLYSQWEYSGSLSVSRSDLARLCGLAFDLEVVDAWDQAERMLCGPLAEQAPEELARLRTHPIPAVRAKAWALESRLRRAALPRLQVRTLGRFQVLRGEAPMKAKDWGGSQATLLLKAILTHGPRPVQRDQLVEALWPEANKEVGGNSLKVALHRLRRALEPRMSKELGSAYIHAEDNLLFMDPELCQVDAQAFLDLAEEGRKKEKAGDLKAATACYVQAAEFYAGDFLAQDVYLEWTYPFRRQLKDEYLDLLLRLAGIYEKQGTLGKATTFYQKAITVDPCLEQAYQKLMALYERRGKRSLALQAYHRCRETLREQLDVEPDATTTALFRRLQTDS